MKSGGQKAKDKTQQQFQSSAAKSREPTELFAASITPTNNNSAEKACNALLVIIQLQRQSFLAFPAANLLNTVFRHKMISFKKPHVLTLEISNAINAAEMF